MVPNPNKPDTQSMTEWLRDFSVPEFGVSLEGRVFTVSGSAQTVHCDGTNFWLEAVKPEPKPDALGGVAVPAAVTPVPPKHKGRGR